jgi:hypothetical protein
MRLQAVIVLLAIALSIVVPPSLLLTISHSGQASIGILEVCHSATPAISSNGDMPGINEYSYAPLPLALDDTTKIEPPLSKPFFISFQDERPPKDLS